MRKLTILILLLVFFTGSNAQTLKSLVTEDGGSGKYKAVMTSEAQLSGFTVYRPENPAAAASEIGPMPVLLWCNGGCRTTSDKYENFLSEIASYGYVAIAIGEWPGVYNPNAKSDAQAQQRAPQPNGQRARPAAQAKEKVPAKSADNGIPSQKKDALALLEALNVLEQLNQDKSSIFYNTVNTDNVAAMGQSCGGLQSLILGTSGDSRIKTTIVQNSGIFNNSSGGLGNMITKEELQKLAGPVIYIIGGPNDISYPNATNDYPRIKNVPAAFVTLDVGHQATYHMPHGGEYAKMALAWLNMTLKGDNKYSEMFRSAVIPEEFSQWSVESKNFNTEKVISLPAPPSDVEEKVRTDKEGHIESFSNVTRPEIYVRLAEPYIANGSAVLIFPGGGLSSLAWKSEFEHAADYLNSKGIAAIGVKYRTNVSKPSGTASVQKKSASKKSPNAGNSSKSDRSVVSLQNMNVKIADFGIIKNANTSPGDGKSLNETLDKAAEDALNAMNVVLENANDWGLNKDKIGWMGFSAGGGVELAALMKAKQSEYPAFIASVYGPSLIDISVPENAPKLFIAVHADHVNVAAGCTALFLEWKKAGCEAEMHIYGKYTGDLYGGAKDMSEVSIYPSGDWLEQFYSWLYSNGLI